MKTPSKLTSKPTLLAPAPAAIAAVEPHPLQGAKDQYDHLCAERDAAYARAAPLEEQLDQVNHQVTRLQSEANSLASQIEAIWGPNWLQLKKQIGILAGALGAVNGLLAKKD